MDKNYILIIGWVAVMAMLSVLTVHGNRLIQDIIQAQAGSAVHHKGGLG